MREASERSIGGGMSGSIKKGTSVETTKPKERWTLEEYENIELPILKLLRLLDMRRPDQENAKILKACEKMGISQEDLDKVFTTLDSVLEACSRELR